MNIRVQQPDGTITTIELPQDAWQVLRLGSLNTLVSTERTHSFDEDGHYLHTEPMAADKTPEALPSTGMDGLEPRLA